MELKLFKSLWGMPGTLEEQFERIAKAGYVGIETGLPVPENESRFKELLEKYGFGYIAMVFESDAEGFEASLHRAKGFHPLSITSHSARDSMDYEAQLAFFDKAIAVEKEIGITVGHETHRQRSMYAPWTTSRLLKDLPELRITADFSHWCCVCESLLENQNEHLDIAIERAVHIHGRVGFAEGPQVADPRAPEYKNELAAHETWWDRICASRAKQGASFITFTPEFGPPGYMHTLPFTNQPVTDLWEVCLWMAQRFESRYKK